MSTVTTVGLDLAKSVFQVHGADAQGKKLTVRTLRRSEVIKYFAKLPQCLVGIEACGSAHYWAREIAKLGHTVKLMPPKYVKPYVKRGKSDAIDAEAICEAVQRPSMTFVATKSETQQGHAALHSVRQLLVGQRTQAINALRGHMSEFGIVSPRGLLGMEDLARIVMDRDDARLQIAARAALAMLVAQIEATSAELARVDAALQVEHRTNEASRRLETIPGVGPITASALRARIGDGKQFENGRHFAAWAGLVPVQNSSGSKEKQCGISKKGDRYLRTLFVNGAMAVVQQAQRKPEKYPRIVALLARLHPKAVAVAVANRTARVAWAILTKGGTFVAKHGGTASASTAAS